MAQRRPSKRKVKWLPLQSKVSDPSSPVTARPVKRISGETAGVKCVPPVRSQAVVAAQSSASRAIVVFFMSFIV